MSDIDSEYKAAQEEYARVVYEAAAYYVREGKDKSDSDFIKKAKAAYDRFVKVSNDYRRNDVANGGDGKTVPGLDSETAINLKYDYAGGKATINKITEQTGRTSLERLGIQNKKNSITYPAIYIPNQTSPTPTTQKSTVKPEVELDVIKVSTPVRGNNSHKGGDGSTSEGEAAVPTPSDNYGKGGERWFEQGQTQTVKIEKSGIVPDRDRVVTNGTDTFSGETPLDPFELPYFDERKTSSDYVKTYTSYSGHDMVCSFELPLRGGGAISQVVGEIQTITYSIHNEKMPVRVLGDMNMKGMVFGNRTIAGSMVFVVFDRHWAQSMTRKYLKAINSGSHALMDEMPPLNVTITMANEYGSVSRLALYGVSLVNEGQVMSIQDIYTENTYQFYAKDIDYLTNVVNYNHSGSKNYGDGAKDKPAQAPDDPNAQAPLDNPSDGTKVPSRDDAPAKENNEDPYADIDWDAFDVYGITDTETFKDKTYREVIDEIDDKYKNIVLAGIEDEYNRGKDGFNGGISLMKKKAFENVARSVWLDARRKAEQRYLEVV